MTGAGADEEGAAELVAGAEVEAGAEELTGAAEEAEAGAELDAGADDVGAEVAGAVEAGWQLPEAWT